MKFARQLIVAAAVASVLGIGAFLLTVTLPRLFPDRERLALDPGCDLREGPCDRGLPGGGRLSFAMTPPDLPLMVPLELEVRLSGASVDAVLVDIVGLNMDMGVNRTRLQLTAPGVWRGSTVLPVCSRSTMRWEAAVWLERGGRLLAVPHRFQTQR